MTGVSTKSYGYREEGTLLQNWEEPQEVAFEVDLVGWDWVWDGRAKRGGAGGRLVIDSSSVSLSTQTRKMISMWENVQTGFPFSPLNTGIFPPGALDYVSLCFSVLTCGSGEQAARHNCLCFSGFVGSSEKNMTRRLPHMKPELAAPELTAWWEWCFHPAALFTLQRMVTWFWGSFPTFSAEKLTILTGLLQVPVAQRQRNTKLPWGPHIFQPCFSLFAIKHTSVSNNPL